MAINENDVGFAADLTDGVEKWEWKTRYIEGRARWGIYFEVLYLLLLMGASLYVTLQFILTKSYFGIVFNEVQYSDLSKYIFAISGGLFGGGVNQF